MSAEAYQPIPEPDLQSHQIELNPPRDKDGRRLGIGAIYEKRRPEQRAGEKGIFQTVFQAVVRSSRVLQAPEQTNEQEALRDVRSQLLAQQETSQVHQWAEHYEGGYSYATDEARAKLRVKKQHIATEQPKVL